MINKTQGILEYIDENCIDIAMLQETWLKRGDKSKITEIREYGYKVLKSSRQSDVSGGGVAVLYKSNIVVNKFTVNSSISLSRFKTFEYICCNIEVKDGIIKLANLHRLPYSNKHRFTPNMFLEEFEDFLHTFLSMPGSTIIAGDFNFHVEENDDRYSNKFLELIDLHNLKQHVVGKTHKLGGTLDLMLTEDLPNFVHDVVVDEDFEPSDHFPINFSALCSIENESFSKTVIVRNVRNLDLDKFREDLQNSSLCDPSQYCNTSLNYTVELYDTVLSELFNKHCPSEEKHYKAKHSKSRWYNRDLQLLKQNKRRAERKAKKYPTPENKRLYTQLKNEYNFKLNETRDKFHKQTIEDSKNDKKSLNKAVNKLIGNVKDSVYPTFDSPQNIADSMTDYYSQKVVDIHDNIKSDNSRLDLQLQPEIPFPGTSKLQKFSPLNSEKLTKLIMEMNSKTSILDPLPTSIVKKCLDLLLPIILHIVKVSLNEASFPQHLKHASVTPIVKEEENNHQLFPNYRPLSNLTFLSKVLEKVVSEQINSHLIENNLHAKHQSGYKKKHSCETGMFKMVGDVQQMTAKRNHVALLLLDLSSAFDVLNHDILINRLQVHFGIEGDALTWLTTYLKGRTFSVCIQGCHGKKTVLLFGVPQGSLLGPLLFILYSKQIETIALKYGLSVQLYADDSQLYIELERTSDLYDEKVKIESCLKEIQVWMSTNYMKLNSSKTKLIVFNPPRSPFNVPLVNNYFHISFNETQLEESTSVVVLGSTLTPDFRLNSFINTKLKSCKNEIRNLKHVKGALDIDTRFMLINNLILTKLDYCNSLLAGCTQLEIKRLQTVMNDAVRFVFSVNRRAHISQYLQKLHLLPVKFRILFKLCTLAHNIVSGTAPKYLSDIFSCYQPTSSMSLRHDAGRDEKMLVYSPGKLPEKCIFQKLISAWNALPFRLRSFDTCETFKKQLKTYYFPKAYENYEHE